MRTAVTCTAVTCTARMRLQTVCLQANLPHRLGCYIPALHTGLRAAHEAVSPLVLCPLTSPPPCHKHAFHRSHPGDLSLFPFTPLPCAAPVHGSAHAAFYGASWDGQRVACMVTGVLDATAGSGSTATGLSGGAGGTAGGTAGGVPAALLQSARLAFHFRSEFGEVISHVQVWLAGRLAGWVPDAAMLSVRSSLSALLPTHLLTPNLYHHHLYHRCRGMKPICWTS